jgi:phage terminase small subunit
MPTKVKILRGETRPNRVNYSEPLPSSNTPTMSTDMDAEAKAVWRRVITSMGKTGVIRHPDADILRCYCEAVSRYAGGHLVSMPGAALSCATPGAS